MARTEKKIDYFSNPLRLEHYEEIKILLENYWSLYDTQKIKFDYDMVVRIEKMVENLDLIIESENQ